MRYYEQSCYLLQCSLSLLNPFCLIKGQSHHLTLNLLRLSAASCSHTFNLFQGWGVYFWGRLKRSAGAVQLFGCLAVLETHTL